MTNEEIPRELHYLIGTRYVPALCAYVSELTDRGRVHGPNDITTREFDLGRITIVIDHAHRVSGFSFG
ncbi:hypothetical protein NJC38_09900 [Pseudomonas sp. 21LCFQ010]|uniref:hypothetical protein n=1 Tax=unclassified Pseudomonas TaxID=196821 RepID=UPI0004F6471A|nr:MULTISPECIES: hypothetical protein [unclassified Pseudomonas]MCO8162477.1 hypothetical protein [Pseudomonas sp. 21LCFQ010]BAP42302.1 putative uncharacterized protein [Pseudomonas sp. StFLB209]